MLTLAFIGDPGTGHYFEPGAIEIDRAFLS
jgi:hypothetical protein